MAEIFQDKVTIIGKLVKLHPVRYSQVGVPSIEFVISIPSGAKKPTFIPCTIYGKKAEDIEKERLSANIKISDIVEVHGSHRNTYKNNQVTLEVKANDLKEYKQETSLFGGDR